MTQEYIFWAFQVPFGIMIWAALIALIIIGGLKITNMIETTK